MITDENALEISEKLAWPSKRSASTEYYSGFLYDEPATLQYQPIKGPLSAQDTMKQLALNKDEHPGIIKLLGYKPDHLYNGDYLIKIFESFTQTVQTATQNGLVWSEARLLRTLVDLSGAGELLAGRQIRHGRIAPSFLLITAQDCLIKLPLVKQKPSSRDLQSPFSAPEVRNHQRIREIGLADVYSLGATLAYMCLGRVPAEVDAGYRTWLDYRTEIAFQYPLIGSILPKLLVAEQEERYNFRHLKALVGVGDCFALLRMNQILGQRLIRENAAEMVLLCKVVGQTFGEVEVKRRMYLTCKSCKAREEDIGQAGYSCPCGSLNLR